MCRISPGARASGHRRAPACGPRTQVGVSEGGAGADVPERTVAAERHAAGRLHEDRREAAGLSGHAVDAVDLPGGHCADRLLRQERADGGATAFRRVRRNACKRGSVYPGHALSAGHPGRRTPPRGADFPVVLQVKDLAGRTVGSKARVACRVGPWLRRICGPTEGCDPVLFRVRQPQVELCTDHRPDALFEEVLERGSGDASAQLFHEHAHGQGVVSERLTGLPQRRELGELGCGELRLVEFLEGHPALHSQEPCLV